MALLRTRALAWGSALVSAFAFMTTPSANLLQNGSFESATSDPGASFVLHSAGDMGILDWLVTTGNVHHVGTYWEAQDGTRSVDLNGTQSGGIQQTFPTQIGQEYEVSFFLAGNPDGDPLEKLLQVSADGTTLDFSFDTSGRTRTDMGYVMENFFFTANAPDVTLAFSSSVAGQYGAVIDNIVVVERPVSPD